MAGVVEKSGRKRRRVRRVALIATALLVAVIGGIAVVSYDSNPLGHFKSNEGRRAYIAAYERAMKLMPKPRRTLDVKTDYGTVRVYEFGSDRLARPPIVLLPGRSSGVPMWAANAAQLAAERTVFALDALGDSGLSTQTRPITDAADQARWLDEALAGLGIDKAHVVGHSFGGWLAANYAVRYPSRVATLSLIEPVLVFQGIRWRIYLDATVASIPFLPERWRLRMLAHIGGASEIDTTDPLARLITDASQYYAAKVPLPKRISTEELARLDMPVWVGMAEMSSMHGAEAAARVARAHLRDATVTLWPDTTHSLPMERPRQIDRALLDFMAAQEPDRSSEH